MSRRTAPNPDLIFARNIAIAVYVLAAVITFTIRIFTWIAETIVFGAETFTHSILGL
jgi:hypothetical protein